MSQILIESIKKIFQTCFDVITSLSMIWKLGQFIILYFDAFSCLYLCFNIDYYMLFVLNFSNMYFIHMRVECTLLVESFVTKLTLDPF